MTAWILFVLGLLLIFVEFYVPGAIMGILGGIALIASIIFFAQTHELWEVILFALAGIVCVAFLIRFALKRIVSAKPGYSIYLHGDQKGYQASSYDADAIGKTGIVMSDLKPGGYIVIDGKQHQAISLTGYIVKGESVLVVSGQEESLIVRARKINQEGINT